MSKVIRLLPSDENPNVWSKRKYFIDDQEVSELQFYDLQHLENAELEALHIALQEERKNEPFDYKKLDEWRMKCSLIEELITKKVGHRFWADFS